MIPRMQTDQDRGRRVRGVGIAAALLLLASACAQPAATPGAEPRARAPAAGAAAPAGRSGQDGAAVADFYRGKTVRLVVGLGAGGGFDTYSRAIGRHLG